MPDYTMPQYQPIETGLEMGSHYLTKETAYFLGGILSSGECIYTNAQYWIAPARYNYGYASVSEIEQHFSYIQEIASTLGAQTLMSQTIRESGLDSGKFRLPGFGTFFRCSTPIQSVRDFIEPLKDALALSDPVVVRCFLIGVFDGRCSIDVNKTTNAVRYIVVDCPDDDVADFLNRLLMDNGFLVNYNTARDRIEGGRARNPQIRIKDHTHFMASIGLISVKRTAVLESAYNSTYNQCIQVMHDYILPGLKTLEVN